MDGLIEGRMCHYVVPSGRSKNEHRPAVVVKVRHDLEDGMVNLQVFTDGPGDVLPDTWRCASVRYDSDKLPGTWHWIERA